MKYPVTRSELLMACADTPEFTAGEKKWFETSVPEARYTCPSCSLMSVG